MSDTSIKGIDVINLIYEGDVNCMPGKKAAGTKLLRKYVAQQSRLGKSPVMVEAGIRAHVTKMKNGN